MKSKIVAACLALPLMMGFGSVASALTYTSASVPHGVSMTVSGAGLSSPEGARVGEIRLYDSSTSAEFFVFCLDIFDNLQMSGGTLNVVTPFASGSPGGTNPPSLSLTSTQVNQIGGLIVNGHAAIQSAATTSAKNVASAAAQVAIWMTEYAGSAPPLSLSAFGGNAATVATVLSLANTYIANVQAGGAWDGVYNVTLLTDGDGGHINQSLTFAIAGTPITPVPLPASLPLFITGLAGLGLLGKRRIKIKRAA